MKVKIHSHRVLFFPGTLRRKLPKSWKEIRQPRRLFVFRALLKNEGLPGTLEALRLLLRVKPSTFRRINREDLAALLDQFPWLRAAPSPVPVFQEFKTQSATYRMADANFVNGSCMEYALADEYLTAFLEGDEKALPLLTATLMREYDPDQSTAMQREDLRVKLHGRMEVEHRASLQKKFPQEVHIASLLYFAGVKQLIARLYGAWLFEKPDEDDPEPKKGDPLGWWGIFMDNADGDVTRLDAIQQSNFHNFCTMEVRRRKQAKEAEMRMRMSSAEFGKE